MPTSITATPRETQTPTDPIPAPRLRTVTGNRWPRKCGCGCGFAIPRDPEIRYVVDFGSARPYPAYLREHSPDYGKGDGGSPARVTMASGPSITSARDLPQESPPLTSPPAPTNTRAPDDAAASPSPEAGRAWASGQLVYNAGSFESARSAFADYAREGETGTQLRARVNRILLEDLELKVLALRALHEKLRDRLAGTWTAEAISRGKSCSTNGADFSALSASYPGMNR